MLFTKIARITRNHAGRDYYRVEYGFRPEEIADGKYTRLPFAKLNFERKADENQPNASEDNTYTYIRGCVVKSTDDGRKEITISNNTPISPYDGVEALLVIIPNVYKYETNGKKIAGECIHEGIVELEEGDYMTVYFNTFEKERYEVIKSENELFLVKKTR